ncbi:hypothetical protein V3C99_012745 [Haemonchus contortus]|uniref:Secreted protein n=1 Tax=Haemonchus contortus TaxID=6289 RepID=A0A7I4Y4A6_HAECO
MYVCTYVLYVCMYVYLFVCLCAVQFGFTRENTFTDRQTDRRMDRQTRALYIKSAGTEVMNFRTNRQTDGQTDGQTDASALYKVRISVWGWH